MAKEEVKKNVVFLRELFGKGDQTFQVYANLDRAIKDQDPKVKPEIYKANLELIGSLKWAMIPVDGSCPIPEADPAVSVEIVAGKPVNQKPKK